MEPRDNISSTISKDPREAAQLMAVWPLTDTTFSSRATRTFSLKRCTRLLKERDFFLSAMRLFSELWRMLKAVW